MREKNIIMVAPHINQPRLHKRTRQLKAICNAEVFAFSRGFYGKNEFPADLPVTYLGRVENARYVSRLFNLYKAIRVIRKRKKLLGDCEYYALGLDCLVIARLSGMKRGYYEIGDLRTVEGTGRFLAAMERWLLKSISGFVLTSSYFYDSFYSNYPNISKEKIYVIDNKVIPSLLSQRPREKSFAPGRIIIGLIGFFRYQRPTELLLQFVKANPDKYVLECFGDGPLKDLIESYKSENIRYHGAFKNPEDLPGIYNMVHLNYVVYDSSSINVQLAIPNKLFESAFFGVPITCCENTALGKMSEEWGIGRMVRIGDYQEFAEDMEAIDFAWLENCSVNCFKIPAEKLIDDGSSILEQMLSS